MKSKKQILEDYLNNQIAIHELIIRLDNLQEKERKSKGVIYTPWDIVNKMVQIANITYDTTIIEPSCGHGIFLFGILEHMRLNLKMSPELLLNWFMSHILAIELNTQTVCELKEVLHYYFKKQGILVLEEEFKNIIDADSLILDINKNFDLCIGNPPYIRARELESDYLNLIKSKFLSCEAGNIDIYYAFIEKFSKLAQSLCFITPNSLIQNKSAKVLRSLIVDKIDYLIDFKEKLIFSDARTYTCIFKLNSHAQTKTMFYSNDTTDMMREIDKSLIFNEKIKIQPTINPVLSGIATLCDSVYLVEKKGEQFFASYNGIKYEIEKEIIAPFLKLTKQKSSQSIHLKYMIYPYNKNRIIIDESTLKTNFPLAYTYLEKTKSILATRDKGKIEKYEAWYAYGRRQGLHEFKTDYIITIPLMIGKTCKPQKLNIKSLLQEYTNIIFSSGYVVPIDKQNQTTVKSILTTEFINYAKEIGKAWPGKDEAYYSLNAKQIREFKAKILVI